jgi:hypothetical protein
MQKLGEGMADESSDLFQFEWGVDQHGYELLPPDADDGSPGATLLSGKFRGWFIRRKGGPLRFYRPLTEHRGLFREFANVGLSPEDMLSFVQRYGLLYEGDSQSVDELKRLRLLFWTVAKMIDEHPNEKRLAAPAYNNAFKPRMTIRLDYTHKKRVGFRIVPLTLFGAMAQQLGTEISDDQRFKKCKFCPTWFPIGKGTGHRETKEFCSDKCRVGWHRAEKGTSL